MSKKRLRWWSAESITTVSLLDDGAWSAAAAAHVLFGDEAIAGRFGEISVCPTIEPPECLVIVLPDGTVTDVIRPHGWSTTLLYDALEAASEAVDGDGRVSPSVGVGGGRDV